MGILIKKAFRAIGYNIQRANRPLPYHGYDLEAEARTAIERVNGHTMVSFEKLVPLYQQAAFCEQAQIPGAFVECGVWKGGCVGIMAQANLKYGSSRRHLHLFDSFEGIPEPDAEVDGAAAVKFAKEAGGGVSGKLVALEDQYGGVGTLQSNRDLMETQLKYDPAFLHYHVGWFQDTVPKDAAAIGPIAILRLDGDWYASTKICLDHLYDQVVRGGFVIIDDFKAYEGCEKAVREFLAARGETVYLHHLDRWGRYWIKP
jgi:hypothetical protein